MAFRYINPGYAELFDTVADGFSTVNSTVYNPTNAVAIKGVDSISTILPAGYISNIFYCRADIYVEGAAANYSDFRMGLLHYNALSNKDYFSGVFSYYGQAAICHYGSRLALTQAKFKSNALNTLTFSMNYKDATAFCTLNGETISAENLSNIQYYNEQSPFAVVLYSGATANYYLSNLIISDQEISPKEQVISLPIKSTSTDMATTDDGIFIADAANQSLLSGVDVSSLIDDYGADSAVTGIALVGKPAYKTATGITSLISLSMADSIVTEHNSVNLSDDTTAAVTDGWSLDNITIADLAKMQFGWKVGA